MRGLPEIFRTYMLRAVFNKNLNSSTGELYVSHKITKRLLCPLQLTSTTAFYMLKDLVSTCQNNKPTVYAMKTSHTSCGAT